MGKLVWVKPIGGALSAGMIAGYRQGVQRLIPERLRVAPVWTFVKRCSALLVIRLTLKLHTRVTEYCMVHESSLARGAIAG